MKIKFNKISVIVAVILIFATAECGGIQTALNFDKMNPCRKGDFYDAKECEYWKTHFPGEYKRYLKRMEKNDMKKKNVNQ